jgi:hypothetical protein
MKRLYTVQKSFFALSPAHEAREFKPGQRAFCDLEQLGDSLAFEQDNFEWFVDRQTFTESCVLLSELSAKHS